MIPKLVARLNRNEAHATFDQPPRDQASRAKLRRGRIVEAVKLLRRVAFLAEVERLLCGGLHPRREFVAGDARVEVKFAGALFEMLAVQLFEEREIFLLRLAAQTLGRIEVEDARLARADDGALKDRGQPA